MNLSIEQILLYQHYIKKIQKVEDLERIFTTIKKYEIPSSIKRLEFSDFILKLSPKLYTNKIDTSLFLSYEEYIYDNYPAYLYNDMLHSYDFTIPISNVLSDLDYPIETITYLLKAAYLIRHGWYIHEELGVRFYIISPDKQEEYYIDSHNPTCSCTSYNCFHYALVKIYMKYRSKLNFLVIQ